MPLLFSDTFSFIYRFKEHRNLLKRCPGAIQKNNTSEHLLYFYRSARQWIQFPSLEYWTQIYTHLHTWRKLGLARLLPGMLLGSGKKPENLGETSPSKTDRIKDRSSTSLIVNPDDFFFVCFLSARWWRHRFYGV